MFIDYQCVTTDVRRFFLPIERNDINELVYLYSITPLLMFSNRLFGAGLFGAPKRMQ